MGRKLADENVAAVLLAHEIRLDDRRGQLLDANSGTPSVLATIWSSTSGGKVLPPVTLATMSALSVLLSRRRFRCC